MAEEQNEIWRYVALHEYRVPRDGSTGKLSGLGRVWRSFRAALGEAPIDRDYQRATRDDLDALVPSFDLEATAGALRAVLGDWPQGDLERGPVRVVVGPPGTHSGAVVDDLAESAGWRRIEAPRRAELLSDTATDPELPAPASSEPIVLARLEKWLLRSERSLPSMRTLLDSLRRRAAPILIGCDSWAWSFLDSTLGVSDLLGEPLVLAPLDGAELFRWLEPPLAERRLACRSADDPERAIFGSTADPDTSLLELARVARGNPGIALELWRRSLRVTRDGEDVTAESLDRLETLWATPAVKAIVTIPHELQVAHEIVLHAVLLHAGLEERVLTALVPFPRHDLSRRVRELVADGLLAETDGELAVPLAAYAGVREYLASEGYLVDGF